MDTEFWEMKNKVLVSILNWNSAANTAACIRSVQQISYEDYSIIIIDNASQDDSVSVLQKKFPEIHFVQLIENKGYAAAHAHAFRYGQTIGIDFLWILNNDLTVYPNALSALVQSYQRYGDAVYGSLVLEAEDGDTVNFAGGWELSARGGLDYMTPYNHFMGASWSLSKNTILERKVSDVNGCSLFLPMSVITKYGFMEDLFFLYKEETDYCFTLMENTISSIIVPNSIVVHQSGGSFVNHRLKCLKVYYSERNLILFMKRHPLYFAPFRNPFKKYAPLWKSLLNLTSLFISGKSNSEDFYKNLGVLHAMMGVSGKYFKPEKYL